MSVPLLRQTRALTRRMVEHYSFEQLTTIPSFAKNHMLWHAGHLVVTQQLLHYGLSGLDLLVPDELVARYRKGTSPLDWPAPDDEQARADLEAIRELLTALPERLSDDYAAGRFERFEPYMTSARIELTSFEQALAFNNFHEGLHQGIMLQYRKVV